jgi:hypothetical protein
VASERGLEPEAVAASATDQQAARAAGLDSDRSRVLVAALAGVLLALTIWGGRLDVIPRGLLEPSSLAGINQVTTVTRNSGDSQLAHRSARGAGSRLPTCQTPESRASHRSHASSAAACAHALSARRFSAGASAR